MRYYTYLTTLLTLGLTSSALLAAPASSSALAFSSQDGTRTAQLKGLLQADYKQELNGETLSSGDGFYLKRFRTDLHASFYDFIYARTNVEYANGSATLLDASFLFKFSPRYSVKLGKDKSFVGLEVHQSPNDILFSELSLVSNLIPNRDLGLSFIGTFPKMQYIVGVFNGSTDLNNSSKDNDSSRDLIGRVFFTPLPGVGFGFTASYGNRSGVTSNTLLPTYQTPAQTTFFKYSTDSFAEGEQVRFSPQGYIYKGPFGVFYEYVSNSQSIHKGNASVNLAHHAWHVAFNYVFTGETRSFEKGIVPKSPFDATKKSFGALEAVLRVHQLSLDKDTFPTYATSTSFTKATSVGIGLNWFPVKESKVSLSLDKTYLEGYGSDKNKEETVLTLQNQISF